MWRAVIVLLFVCVQVAAQSGDYGPNLEDKAVKKVTPPYPALAKRKRVQGKVIVSVRVEADGAVSAAEVLEGNSLLKPASLEAARQWVFKKSTSGMSGHIVFKFQLDEE